MEHERWWLVWDLRGHWQVLEFEDAGTANIFKEQMGLKTATVTAAASKHLALESVRGKSK